MSPSSHPLFGFTTDRASETCPPNPGLEKSSFDSDFTKGKSALDGWKTTAGHVETGPNGAEFTINKKGDAPTIQTDFYFLFAKVDVTMKIAPGTGIVSSVVLQSDDLDEIDWVRWPLCGLFETRLIQ